MPWRASKAAVISALRADCAARFASFLRRFSSISFITCKRRARVTCEWERAHRGNGGVGRDEAAA